MPRRAGRKERFNRMLRFVGAGLRARVSLRYGAIAIEGHSLSILARGSDAVPELR
jgi:hypothetical protein